MRLFNAAVYTSNFGLTDNIFARLNEQERALRMSHTNILESYHYIHKQIKVDRIRRDCQKVFLDSGAFSAFTLGTTIDLGEYCDYILRNEDIVEVASVLDAIGTKDSAADTWRNQDAMERRGVQPLPCFHYGEPTEVLDHYVANYGYITIGGMVPISTPQLRIWLDRLWEEHLTHDDGTPKVKVHGFGLTSLPLMVRYPWYSVDSSTWQAWGSNGMILMPGRVGQIDLSNQSPRRKQRNQHLDSLPGVMTEAVEREILSKGIDPERLRCHYFVRWAWNFWAFAEYVKDKVYETDKFQHVEQRLF